MASNVNIRSCRLRQVPLKVGSRKMNWFALAIPGEIRKVLAVTVVIALMAGMFITQFFHGQVVDTRARVLQLQSKNAAIGNENIRLLATRAQLASKANIVSHAGVKLNLFEPEKGQVHRM